MKNPFSGCLDPLGKDIDLDQTHKEERVDLAWCSELCKQKVGDYIVQKYPCRQKLIRVDVCPLYASDPQRYYRVSLWVHNWAGETMGPAPEMWKTFCVTLQGVERRIVSIVESRRSRLALGQNGQKLMDELGILQESGA